VQIHRQIKKRLLGLTAVEKLRAKQCSRQTMIKVSSYSFKLFFIRANARKRKSYIQSLQVEGSMVFSHQIEVPSGAHSLQQPVQRPSTSDSHFKLGFLEYPAT
jgi:hypothetical protein